MLSKYSYLVLFATLHYCVAQTTIVCDLTLVNGEPKKDCREVCADGCPNGTCDITHTKGCVCNSGYELINGRCERRVCRRDCGANAICVGTNTCKCKDGYSDEFGVCKPICAKVCGKNAICISPNKCQCKDGYQEIDGVCKPMCLQNVCKEHSSCVAPDICNCHNGYYINQDQCEPVCPAGCGKDSQCAKPNECVCKDGYEINKATDVCEPICEEKCGGNSRCSAPNKCECLEGFLNKEGKCESNCAIYEGGNASAAIPQICKCEEGYILSGGQCIAKPCSESINLLFGHSDVSCSVSALVLWLYYNSLTVFVLLLVWFSYKGVMRYLASKRHTRKLQNEDDDNAYNYVINYQSSSQLNMAGESNILMEEHANER